MAAAEARTAWQRTANRCFVQEDAKRAPKLACCSPSQSNPHPNGDTPNGTSHPASSFTPLNWNPANTNLPPDTKWWLQLQPNFTYQKDFPDEQLNALEAELEGMRDGEQVPTSTVSEKLLLSEDFHSDLNKVASATCLKHEPEALVQPLKTVNGNPDHTFKNKACMGENWLMDWKPIDLIPLNQPEKNFSDLETPWMGSEKVEPWWRTADKDELASLVAQKSQEHIENCDLPRPQNMNVKRSPFTGLKNIQCNGTFHSSLDPIYSPFCKPVDYSQFSPASKSGHIKHCSFDEVVHSPYDSVKPSRTSKISTQTGDQLGYLGDHKSLSLPNQVVCYIFTSSITNCYASTDKGGPVDSIHFSESDPSNAQLLEALRHSQTRAREAEEAALRAYTEKEHIVKLFFRQASQLFAYKQWLHFLQLEALCLQLKTKDHEISTLFPAIPWIPAKSKHLRKAGENRRKVCPLKSDFSRYFVAFAVGLSLAGAGLLLGWTMGWLVPGL